MSNPWAIVKVIAVRASQTQGPATVWSLYVYSLKTCRTTCITLFTKE